MARGRPSKSGRRKPCGRRVQAAAPHDHGNDRVQAHRAPYLAAGNGDAVRANDDLFCAIGQAHAAGLLDGTAFDGRALMDHGREWHRLVRAVYGGTTRTSNLEKIGRSRPNPNNTATDHRYEDWAAIVGALPWTERHVLNLVCVEHGEGWALPPFLLRLVNEWRVARGFRPIGYDGAAGDGPLPTRADREQLDRLKAALATLVRGARRRRAA